jgi:hypothetical protein
LPVGMTVAETMSIVLLSDQSLAWRLYWILLVSRYNIVQHCVRIEDEIGVQEFVQ